MAGTSASTQRNWLALVVKIEGPEFHRKSLYPVVYEFRNRTFRDSGPASGIYESS